MFDTSMLLKGLLFQELYLRWILSWARILRCGVCGSTGMSEAGLGLESLDIQSTNKSEVSSWKSLLSEVFRTQSPAIDYHNPSFLQVPVVRPQKKF